MRTIKVCAGIGDNVWLLQKLINSGERFNFQLPDGKPQRGTQVFELLPQVANSAEYVKGLSYKALAANTAKGVWSNTPPNEFYLSCNEWLEHGKMLKDWMPDLPISYKLPWHVSAAQQATDKFIGIYGSAYSTQRAWKQYGAWGLDQWVTLIKAIYDRNQSYTFVIMGAEWDTDFSTQLQTSLDTLDIPFINAVGSTLAETMQWMRKFHYAFYFPSGLPIISESLEGGSDCTMFYTTNISKIAGTWADPERIASGQLKECLFCKPAAIFDWCVENGKI